MSDHETPPMGYMNPPVNSRFNKGKSGNPKGRPKKRPDAFNTLQKVLKRKIRAGEDSEPMPIQEALVRKLRNHALAGDRRALDLQRRILDEADAGREELHRRLDVKKILRRHEERVARLTADAGESSE
uniref:DUF5681 domain-containing protein n=1 Tax=Pararhizobium sp. IMCC3301 TaxID=3067904 RepID=UPI0027421A55|nr:DUF5681 domain-containing protein [Pararhizobium sp. IMCC3301]